LLVVLPSSHSSPASTMPLPQVVQPVEAEQEPVAGLHVPAVLQPGDGVQATGFVPVQVPPWQTSLPVQAFPSSHDAPLAFAGLVHAPEEGSQVPTSWHPSCATQVTGAPPVQVPLTQVSTVVHALPSEHAVPLAFEGLLHTPVAWSQVPTAWH
jgi:hypothetical protein